MGSCVSRDLFTSAHKNSPRPQGTDLLNRDLPSSHSPAIVPDHVAGKDKQMDFCWDPWQRCFQTTNGYISDSRACPSNYSVAALATSSLVGRSGYPPLALRDCTLFHGHVLLVAKGHRHAGFDGFLNCQTSSWVPSLGSWIAEFSGPLPRDVSEERVQAVGV